MTAAQDNQLQLLVDIGNPGISSPVYAVKGMVRHEAVQGDSHNGCDKNDLQFHHGSHWPGRFFYATWQEHREEKYSEDLDQLRQSYLDLCPIGDLMILEGNCVHWKRNRKVRIQRTTASDSIISKQ